MFIFDQLKKNEPQLRWLALIVALGLGVLLAGLWWVQVVSARDYQAHLEMQSFRTVRIPAVRGKILDRNGNVLAENRPAYNVSLYLDELRGAFDAAASVKFAEARTELKHRLEAEGRKLNRKLTKEEKKQFVLTLKEKDILRQQARYEVASNVVVQISQRLRLPQAFSLVPTNFERHYEKSLAMPFPILTNLTPAQIALFEEQSTSSEGIDLEMQSTRVYPNKTVAAHLTGSVNRDNISVEGEESFVSYRLPDYYGQIGVEKAYDKVLRGKAGVKSVLVNNLGFRQTENVWTPAEPGQNVVLTLDLPLQQKAEHALQIFGPGTRGAAVVLDVETGDVLVMASSPTIDPNDSVMGYPPGELTRRADPQLRPERNRATQEKYAPGSIFKTLTGLACLEAGLDPNLSIHNPGFIYVGKRSIRDLALPGDYNFRKALMHSSNTYFISNGLRAGIENIIRLGQRFHLGEGFGLQTHQETAGNFPSPKRISANWHDGDTANVCIGQGELAVTPLQMTVMIAAIANGGKVLWPRIVDRIESQDPAAGPATNQVPRVRVRDNLGVRPANLKIVHDAMLADVEDPGGTGTKAAVPGLNICGKTGTAQVMDEHNRTIGETTWFASFAPYEHPRYAVVVMIEMGRNEGSGGGTCAPIAGNIYKAIQERERRGAAKPETLAKGI
jgi:penicillin-binding protein 2